MRTKIRDILALHLSLANCVPRAAALALISGCAFHSAEGMKSRLLTAVTLEAAREFIRGVKSVPLEYQEGAYRHRDDLETDVLV